VPHTIVIDEPERALHSEAQRQVAEAIYEMVGVFGFDEMDVEAAIVASHSPAFLSLSAANLIHVSRGSDGLVLLDTIDPTLRVEGLTASLGIHRSDALLTTRWFVFVEGEHDRAVVNALFADDLRTVHAVLDTMEGAKNIEPYVTAKYLLGYSDANVRVVVDGVGRAATEGWSEARKAVETGDENAARRALERISRLRGREAQWLYEAGLAALERGAMSRIDVVGLDEPDILNYLPVKAIVPDAESWNSLASEWRASNSRQDFKAWLRTAAGASINALTLGAIAERLVDRSGLERIVEGL
jgi:hypothetical protein